MGRGGQLASHVGGRYLQQGQSYYQYDASEEKLFDRVCNSGEEFDFEEYFADVEPPESFVELEFYGRVGLPCPA